MARKNYQLWKRDRVYLSLEFREINSNEYIWSIRVGIGLQALGIMRDRESKIVVIRL